MKVFINVETEGKNKEELTAEIVMVKSFAVKRITELFPSVKADKDIDFVDAFHEVPSTCNSKHEKLANHAKLQLLLADCDILINPPKTTGYRRRNGSSALANAAADFGIPIVDLSLNDYRDPDKGMNIDVIDYRDATRRGTAYRSGNAVYSRYDQANDYEEEEVF